MVRMLKVLHESRDGGGHNSESHIALRLQYDGRGEATNVKKDPSHVI